MAVSYCKGVKRKVTAGFFPTTPPPPKSSKVTFLSPSLLLLEIPPDANTSLPVWEAMRSQQVDVTWTVNPYSASVQLTPMTSNQGKGTSASSNSEDRSNVSQTPMLSLQAPQIVIQSISQQHDAPPKVMLTLSQNGSQSLPCPQDQHQKKPPNPANLSTSFILPLPLVINQLPSVSQPDLPTIETPTAMPSKPQPPSKAPVARHFHTRSSPDVQICDSFLLNLCHSGKKCKMHHTLYPFHWQLWCVTTHQWIDINPQSQVLLERAYCDVNQDVVWINDGCTQYQLDFDTMELDNPLKYDGVRRLTNSDSPARNPHFPSQWKIYWWNNFSWEEYNKNISTLLLKKMSEKEPECSFFISSKEYKLDFTAMTQTNVTTGFQRDVRCRPIYRSPDSLHPYLQTVIQTDPPLASDPPGANFSVNPLEEFVTWYPPVWCQVSKEEYSLVDVPAGTQAYRKVQSLFYESLPETKVDIVSIQQVQNIFHWDKYQRHKIHMQKLNKSKPLEGHLFHGTTKDASEDICHNNFDPRLAGINGASFGFGTYFATIASLAKTFSHQGGPEQLGHMFLAKVLVGKVTVGRSMYRRPPALVSKTKKYRLYDSCVDSLDKPTMFVVFDSCQCYPYYLIKFKDLPKEIDI